MKWKFPAENNLSNKETNPDVFPKASFQLELLSVLPNISISLQKNTQRRDFPVRRKGLKPIFTIQKQELSTGENMNAICTVHNLRRQFVKARDTTVIYLCATCYQTFINTDECIKTKR